MWILLWIAFSAFVIGVFVWSMDILQKQKKSWAAVAKNLGLNYVPGKFTQSSVVGGLVKGRKVSLYTGAQQTADVRGKRFVTIIEIEAGAGMPTAAALATKDYANFLAPLKLNETVEPPVADWDKSYIIKTRSKDALAKYLTMLRLKTLHGIFSRTGASALFFFDEKDSVLRVETSDPLRNAERAEKIIRQLLAAVDILMPEQAPQPQPEPQAAPEASETK